MKKTPNRSLQETKDNKGVPYSVGNRLGRRIAFKNVLKKKKPLLKKQTKGNTLPKALWEKGKSKFVDIRLRQEGKQAVAELCS